MGLFGFGSRQSAFRQVKTPEDLAQATNHQQWILFKHSPFCGVSVMARRRVARFAKSREDLPVYLVDVARHRETSDQVEQLFGVRHESPQVILLQRSRAQWSASHGAVTEEHIEEALAAAAVD